MTKLAATHAVRPTAVAGRFYPGAAAALRAAVQGYLHNTPVPRLDGVRALIAPHAGYVCSGAVAGAAFQTLQDLPAVARVVYLLGPAHCKAVHGVGMSHGSGLCHAVGGLCR